MEATPLRSVPHLRRSERNFQNNMTKPKISRFLSSALVTSLALVLGAVVYWASDKQGVVSLPTGQAHLLCTAVVSVVLGMAHYCWSIHQAFDLKIVRREKILKRRSDLDSSWCSSDFVSSSLYQEIRPYLSQVTVEAVEDTSATSKWEVMRGQYGVPGVSESKISMLRDIGEVEKSWGLI